MANALRDLSRYNTNCSEAHIEAMHRAMRYATATPNRGLLLAPSGMWDGDPTYAFNLCGYADASYRPYQDTSMSADTPYFFKMLLSAKSQRSNSQPHCL
jgi:hypothetical protein